MGTERLPDFWHQQVWPQVCFQVRSQVAPFGSPLFGTQWRNTHFPPVLKLLHSQQEIQGGFIFGHNDHALGPDLLNSQQFLN